MGWSSTSPKPILLWEKMVAEDASWMLVPWPHYLSNLFLIRYTQLWQIICRAIKTWRDGHSQVAQGSLLWTIIGCRRKNLPVVTFHLENADIEVKPEAIFLFREFEGKNVFCLSMLSDDSKTIIGAYQQMKQKFVYDTKARVLSFGPEDCEKNGWDCNFLCFSIYMGNDP